MDEGGVAMMLAAFIGAKARGVPGTAGADAGSWMSASRTSRPHGKPVGAESVVRLEHPSCSTAWRLLDRPRFGQREAFQGERRRGSALNPIMVAEEAALLDHATLRGRPARLDADCTVERWASCRLGRRSDRRRLPVPSHARNAS